ncbi:MAG: hypothetical protein F6K65_04555 [Moorea sp. SIO3C2]|nr:hypothetical protein [Moorena sp. SIO3C2]
MRYKNFFPSCLLPLASCLLPLASCLLPLASCLLPFASSVFPVPCFLFPKTRNFVPHHIENRYINIQQVGLALKRTGIPSDG